MALNAGTKQEQAPGVDEFANSMAAAMENAFLKEWPKVMGGQPAPTSTDQMRLLFIAVAQGMIRYLKTHEADITVRVGSTDMPVKLDTTGTFLY
ncbi:hypothetical protein [Hymenobacter volaticus]|uniref:Uncharacterized protein n=1 Tax=Hymenobacter volaticus TaxID=2932254 RepID=A0ABY4G1R3_9BACT|nr:hypothetical protein [Hymenobacter volaticus]UOQ64810.1 hypothetical protein MUN86_14695 [Hymenobacter volaticus]